MTGPFAGVSIADLAQRVRTGETTAVRLTESALAAADDIGAALNCYVTVDHDGALRAAEQADRELAAGFDRGPMHGIPVGVKDLINTAGLRTTMGSRHFDQHVPTTDAAVVVSLRQAGAVIVGKTHTHEFAYGPTGDVAHTGPARNPHDRNRMTGGSSAGSGAAVAAGLVPAALGTDTGGSVRIPAAWCGIVGLRPTQGAVSGAGVFPLSATLDTVGPMAGSAADTAVLWSVLAGRPVDTPPVTGLRVGVVRAELIERVVPAQAQALERALAELKSAGMAVADAPVPEMTDCARWYGQIQGPEARAVHAKRIETAPELFQPEVLERLTNATEVRGWEYVAAQEARARLRPLFPDRVGADVLVLPTVPIEAPPIGARDTDLGAGWTSPTMAVLACNTTWSVLGLPAISVPVPGDGLPGSVELVGRAGSDDLLLALAGLLAARL
ncbi:MAG TPA: amidase [Pseudonocardiaceae bacterium]|nr:amidase [Pseudonocardiaceae bacterium]